jgi:raffinose/stachyose/melibiose transport system substrate-binding protein
MKTGPLTGRNAALAGAAIGALLLAACSSGGGSSAATGSTASPATTGSITVEAMATGGSNLPALLALVKPFEKKYPNIHVSTQQVPAQSYSSVLTTQLQGGGGPDIFAANFGVGTPPALNVLGKAGKVADLANETWATSLVPAGSKSIYYDGAHLWGEPSGSVPETWIYNTDLFSKWGITPPTTFTAAMSDCAVAKAKGDSMFALAGATVDNAGLTAMMAALSDVYAQTPDWDSQRMANKVTFAGSAGWKQALTDVQQMYNAGCFQGGAAGGTFNDLTRVLGSQQAAGVATPTSSIVTVRSAGATFGMNSMASFGQAASDQRIYINPGFGIAVNASDISNGAVQTFMAFAASPQGQSIQAAANLVPTPAQIQSGKVPDTFGLSGILTDLQTSASQVAWPVNNWPNQQVYTALGQGVTGILTGQTTVASVLQQMDTAWDAKS